jgi:NitT/TauT family transport system permease protein
MQNSTSAIKKIKDKSQKNKKDSFFYTLVSAFLIIAVWKIISLNYNPIILPSPEKAFFTIYEMMLTKSFWISLGYSFFRVISGYLLAMIIGTLTGITMGLNQKADQLLRPVVSMLQTVPNISWILLAIIWFGLNSRIVIFTIFISLAPIFVINSAEGIENTSEEFLEMAAVYRLKPLTIFSKIYLYSIKPYLRSAAVITSERAWKIGAMAELLSLDTGIGAGLYWARNNLQTERIFAWTIVLILMGFLSSKLLKSLLKN